MRNVEREVLALLSWLNDQLEINRLKRVTEQIENTENDQAVVPKGFMRPLSDISVDDMLRPDPLYCRLRAVRPEVLERIEYVVYFGKASRVGPSDFDAVAADLPKVDHERRAGDLASKGTASLYMYLASGLGIAADREKDLSP